MKKEMMRLLTSVCLLAVLLALVACTKEEDDSNRHDSDIYTLNPEGNTDMYEIEPVDLSGYYSGVWWLDYTKVEPESLGYLWYEKYSSKPTSYIDKHDSYKSCIEYNVHNYFISDHNDLYYPTTVSSLMLWEFPFKSLIKKYLHHDEDIKYLTIITRVIGDDGSDIESDLLRTCKGDNVRTNVVNDMLLPFNFVAYSDNMLYYEPHIGELTFPFLFLSFVVTLQDDSYFGVTLHILPTKSFVNVDILAQSLSMSLVIKEMDVYKYIYIDDKTWINKQQITPDKDIIITFASTQRSETPIKK